MLARMLLQSHPRAPGYLDDAAGPARRGCRSPSIIARANADGMAIDSDQLRLTDFMDVATLQEIQDSFAAVANVKATITDAEGNVLTSPAPSEEFLRRQTAIAAAEADGPTREGREYVAPIMVNNQRLGTIRMSANGSAAGVGGVGG